MKTYFANNMKYKNRSILKAIKHYNYEEDVSSDLCVSEFINSYNFSYNNYKKNKYNFENFWSKLGGQPYCTDVPAKNYLFQENELCWKYFDRTALFRTMSLVGSACYIDGFKDACEFALYMEREDLIKIIISKIEKCLNSEDYSQKTFITQKVYPSTLLAFFLISKLCDRESTMLRLNKFGDGYGIYKKVIESWDDFSKIPDSYWDDLCEYHLKAIGLQNNDKRETDEFLGSGLIPMEIINILVVRKKLGLEVPQIQHELFATPMAQFPVSASGYDENIDPIFQMVKRTVETREKQDFEDMKF
jgi:hypothetical protein